MIYGGFNMKESGRGHSGMLVFSEEQPVHMAACLVGSDFSISPHLPLNTKCDSVHQETGTFVPCLG